MKIKEALNFINATTTVRAKVDGDYLNVFSKDMISHNWFLKLNTKAVNWDTVLKHWGGLTDVAPEDLARAMDVIQRLLDTPVEERFPEKKYRLRWIDDRNGKANYAYLDIDATWRMVTLKNFADIFTESELEQLKKDNPHFAPAIDSMKEEVKDDE
ncbi:hypothetical protein CBG24_04575 [Limosilactobacillus reuteri]|uniref:Phage protein n=1 Tax=Limosilactobacillus reuteri TaxID=1598 RepID=A0AB73PGG3_LIMRT|nr:hypothetical protein [Limosilactobacillus reuteri]OYS87596.1 hypothetical protein CBG19_04370 [Limosilactobacillus reuteri]OYS90748.1 hypothetical protein CBG18_05055 [Limosilactobacillus reuteri]OYS94077.1 hypothetical protein CBG15_04885 [Limosilactobacillus reuteri]OYS95660.1 hypothetical protein CBG10_04110 [Limosilactobacillus reuteri]OYS97453.1 hypothetical protein CBG13_04245 [Limosilactobacillus reuteri]